MYWYSPNMFIQDNIPLPRKCEKPMLIWYLFYKCGWLGFLFASRQIILTPGHIVIISSPFPRPKYSYSQAVKFVWISSTSSGNGKIVLYINRALQWKNIRPNPLTRILMVTPIFSLDKFSTFVCVNFTDISLKCKSQTLENIFSSLQDYRYNDGWIFYCIETILIGTEILEMQHK